jgi:hypothetical protein
MSKSSSKRNDPGVRSTAPGTSIVEAARLVGMLAQAEVALESKGNDAGEILGEISQPASTARELPDR